MKKALVIGGSGFIGHHLALTLKLDGFDVAVIDGLEVNNLISLQDSRSKFTNRAFYVKVLEERLSLLRKAGIPVFVEDARDYIRLNRVIVEYKPDAIVQEQPAMVKVDVPNRMVIKRSTISEKMGREFELQEMHMHLITLSGNVDEDDDQFVLEWKS